jgi:hypothetical protein
MKMDATQQIVHDLFAVYNDDQRSMLLDIIQGANGSHETNVVYTNLQIEQYSCPPQVPADQAHCYRDHLDDAAQTELREQVTNDLTKQNYFNLVQASKGSGHPPEPKPKHPKHGR